MGMKSASVVRTLTQQNTLFNQFLSEIRDEEIQKDSMRFRRNLERFGEIFAYEISRELDYQEREIVTSLGIAQIPVLREYPVLATILRAGLPLHQGFLRFFDKSSSIFVAAYRKPHKDGSFKVSMQYASDTNFDGKVLILCDVMIATGSSMVSTYKELMTRGTPSHTHIVTILSSMEGLNHLRRSLPKKDITYWVGGIDEELTAQLFLVPGMGDAGDLAFGKKPE
jgi:uracil phosphoribosyltransferase